MSDIPKTTDVSKGTKTDKESSKGAKYDELLASLNKAIESMMVQELIESIDLQGSLSQIDESLE